MIALFGRLADNRNRDADADQAEAVTARGCRHRVADVGIKDLVGVQTIVGSGRRRAHKPALQIDRAIGNADQNLAQLNKLIAD